MPEISYANPLPGRPAVIAYRDLDRTCAELEHGASFRRLLGPLVERSDDVVALLLGDKRSMPNSPRSALQLGLRMLAQGTPVWGTLAGEDARALFTGVAAHIIPRMPSLTAAGAGMMLATLARSVGWPIPVGGSQAITDALIIDLRAHGGELTADTEVTSPPGGVVAFDTAPTALLRIYGDAPPSRYAKALQRYTFGPGVAKVGLRAQRRDPVVGRQAAAGTHPAPRRHPGANGSRRGRDRRRSSRPVVAHGAGRVAARRRPRPHRRRRTPPLLDLCPRALGVHHRRDRAVTAVVERFAPGCRDVVVAARAVPAARLCDHNANYVGGDIGMGGNSAWRAIAGPTPRLNPWRTPIPKAYLCSAATPPGGGVHGVAGYYAARTLLPREFGIDTIPDLRPTMTP